MAAFPSEFCTNVATASPSVSATSLGIGDPSGATVKETVSEMKSSTLS